MEHFTRIFLSFILLTFVIVSCFATTNSCGANERSNPTGSCLRTCNGCRDCGPCLCKTGYVRSWLGKECMLETDCHKWHLKWMREAHDENKKDNFFNCSEQKEVQ